MAKKEATTRLRKELINFYKDPPPLICVAVNDKNILEWDYLLQGPEETPFEGGEYHGRLRFPANYPHAPPEIVMFTPSGRFRTNYPLCLSMSSYHPESWNPAWSVSTILKGLLSFMVEDTPTEGSIIPPTTDAEKEVFKSKSKEFNKNSTIYNKMFPDGFISNIDDDDESDKEEVQNTPEPEIIPKPDTQPVEEPQQQQQQQQEEVASSELKEPTVGGRVQIKGLTARPDLNGKFGVVKELVGTRWHVQLDDGGDVLKLRKNTLIGIA
eukprot:TRINITY_DN2513_c0_g1_i1.p1 TRINITY_DN2513_c0_g1~~TRINITY_DN2513_c0_g1_i1.p1  ORF type:complete len:268 (+),score=73.67 TRINITY_DN2513_c0_g1_i1:53-856(+)